MKSNRFTFICNVFGTLLTCNSFAGKVIFYEILIVQNEHSILMEFWEEKENYKKEEKYIWNCVIVIVHLESYCQNWSCCCWCWIWLNQECISLLWTIHMQMCRKSLNICQELKPYDRKHHILKWILRQSLFHASILVIIIWNNCIHYIMWTHSK